MPDFYKTLHHQTVEFLALRWLILTGVRPASIRFARFDQIDGDVWTIPAENMKGRLGRTDAFRVTLYATKDPRAERLLNPRRKAQKTKGFRS